MASTRHDIKQAIDAKLRTIKTTAGYQTNVEKVFSDESGDDKIPEGLALDETELPAIFSLSGPDSPKLQVGCYKGNWILELQLWHNEVTDEVMNAFVRDVYKALFAGNATATRRDAFRALDPKLYDINPLEIVHDLNMIEANRCYTLFFELKYTTQLWDL